MVSNTFQWRSSILFGLALEHPFISLYHLLLNVAPRAVHSTVCVEVVWLKMVGNGSGTLQLERESAFVSSSIMALGSPCLYGKIVDEIYRYILVEVTFSFSSACLLDLMRQNP
jgi:hypothetical protein